MVNSLVTRLVTPGDTFTRLDTSIVRQRDRFTWRGTDVPWKLYPGDTFLPGHVPIYRGMVRRCLSHMMGSKSLVYARTVLGSQ